MPDKDYIQDMAQSIKSILRRKALEEDTFSLKKKKRAEDCMKTAEAFSAGYQSTDTPALPPIPSLLEKTAKPKSE